MINGDDVPKVCADCKNSYWEEMCYGEDAFCGEYNAPCVKALSECKYICRRCED